MIQHEGTREGKGLRFAIISSRYNDFITQKLVDGATDCLAESGVAENDIEIFWVPGALEIPAAVSQVVRHGVKAKFFDGIVVIGCVIRGETDHYTFVATEAIKGVQQIALEARIPVGNAILTVENTEQAQERAGEKTMNKGYEAACAALEMVNLFRKIK